VVEVQTKEMSIYERGLELRLAYPNSQTQYLELEKLFVRNASYWSWPDAHPKNILVKEDGSCAFIDFGFSQRGDQRFMLATFLAHIMLYSLAGYVAFDIASKYILECVGEYGCVERAVDEGIFCRYLAMEVLHRANGKWIAGVEKAEDKTRCALFGMKVFDEKMARVDSLIDLLEKVLRVN
jgi:hypothetical protein